MTSLDHLLILTLVVVHPVVSRYNYVAYIKRIAAGERPDRPLLYWQTMGVEWLFLAVLFAVWIHAGRPFELLGFVTPGGSGFWLSVLIVSVAVLLMLISAHRSRSLTQADRLEQRESFGDLGHFLPQSDRELRVFYQVSITAGIVEEIVYRGFVIWYLQAFMGLWAAVAVSSIAFGLGHNYQGFAGIVRTGLVGAILGGLFVVSGSIWVPIAAHILIDVTQGRQIREIYRDVPDPPSAS